MMEQREVNIIPSINAAVRIDAGEQLVSSFLPEMLRTELESLRPMTTISMHPFSRTFRGICLRVEMLGFQAEIDRGLADDDDDAGLSIIQNMTDLFVGSLVSKVYAWGGDIIDFTGSAFICVFVPRDGTASSYRTNCELAMQCAWELKDSSSLDNLTDVEIEKEKELSDSPVLAREVTVRVSMSCGEICLGFLGGYGNQWKFVVAGQCMSYLSSCMEEMASRSVTITRDCNDLLTRTNDGASNESLYTCTSIAPTIGISELPNGHCLVQIFKSTMKHQPLKPFRMFDVSNQSLNHIGEPSHNSDIRSQLYSFAPKPVVEASMMLDMFDDMSCIEKLTCLTVHMVDDENILRSKDLRNVQRHFCACQEIIADVGGYVSHFSVDLRGCMLVALWGVQGALTPDNAQRALGASVRIRSQLMEMNMPCSIAITSGLRYLPLALILSNATLTKLTPINPTLTNPTLPLSLFSKVP